MAGARPQVHPRAEFLGRLEDHLEDGWRGAHGAGNMRNGLGKGNMREMKLAVVMTEEEGEVAAGSFFEI